MARNTFPNLAALERRVRRELPYVVESGCMALAVERGEADLKRENANMPRQARLDADTVKQRRRNGIGTTDPLIETGGLRDSGWVRVRVIKTGPNAGKIRYAIRREGRTTKTISQSAADRRVERATAEMSLPFRLRTKSLHKARVTEQHDRNTGDSFLQRSLPRDNLAGILRSGSKKRGVPARDYSKHLQGWHDAISNRLIRRHLSDQLGKTGLRVIRSGAKLSIQIITTAAEGAV